MGIRFWRFPRSKDTWLVCLEYVRTGVFILVMLRLLSLKAHGRKVKNISTLSCWYSLDSSRWVFTDEYRYARVSEMCQVILHHFILTKLDTSSIRVKVMRSRGTHGVCVCMFKGMCFEIYGKWSRFSMQSVGGIGKGVLLRIYRV